MRYTEGDTVRILSNAPELFRPGSGGSICAARKLNSDDLVNGLKESRGTILWLVEFGDGVAMEIPERFLVPFVPHP
jgi:hypothetical protein